MMFASFSRLLDRFRRRSTSRSVEVLANDDGVKLVLGDGTSLPQFLWVDVTEIRTFKLDLLIYDDIRLAFQAGDLWYEYSEEIEGFIPLTEKMTQVFPTIPEDWHTVVMHPAFATNERVLYQRTIPDS